MELECEKGIAVDTCFIISLINEAEEHHKNADDYFRHFMARGITLYLPVICLSEIMEKQPSLEIKENFKILTFSLNEVEAQHKNFSRSDVNGTDNRVQVKDDVKIIATCLANDVGCVLTANDDFIALAKKKGLRIVDYTKPLASYLGVLPFPARKI